MNKRTGPLAIALLATGLCAAAAGEIHGPAKVVDGDTVMVDGVRVRLKGVDAPELSQPGGAEAAAAMRAIDGTWLACELTGEHTHRRHPTLVKLFVELLYSEAYGPLPQRSENAPLH